MINAQYNFSKMHNERFNPNLKRKKEKKVTKKKKERKEPKKKQLNVVYI